MINYSSIQSILGKSSMDLENLKQLFALLTNIDNDFKGGVFNTDQLTAIYEYHDQNGNLLYFKPRFDNENGKKWIKPMYFDGGGAIKLGEPKNRWQENQKPLYLLPQLATVPADEPIYFVEGEKCVNALCELGFYATTSGASSSIDKSDFIPLMGKKVRIWQDLDDVGDKWALSLAQVLTAFGVEFDFVDVHAIAKAFADETGKPCQKGFDSADFIAYYAGVGAGVDTLQAKINGLPIMDKQAYKQVHGDKNHTSGIIPPTPSKSNKKDDGDKWGEIIPFDEVKNIETPFPSDAFPTLLEKVIHKIAYYQQVPPSMAGYGVLGALSHIGQAFIDAPYINGDYNPSSLFLVVQGESGSGKTQTIKLTHKAIFEYEQSEYELFRENKRLYDNELSSKNKKDTKDFHQNNEKPKDPRSVFGSGSVQKVMQGFTDGNYQNASYTADEGANLLDGASLKAETAGASIGAICDVYSKGIAERITISNTGNQVAYNVRLTLFLSGQEVAIKPALNNARLTNQGLLPRCLFAFPPDNRGDRALITDNFHHDDVLQAYWKKCHNFLELQPIDGKRTKLAWKITALNMMKGFWQEIEPTQKKGGINEHYKPYASRLVENATRIASLFAWYDGRSAIDDSDVAGAVKIVNYSMSERRRYGEIITDTTDAQKLLEWLIKRAKNKGIDKISYSDIQSYAPQALRNPIAHNPALELLSDGNYIYLDEIQTNRRTKRVIEINPKLLQ